VMQSQPLQEQQMFQYQKGQKCLELNMDHPFIQHLYTLYSDTNQDEDRNVLNKKIDILYQTSLIQSGFSLENPTQFGSLIYECIANMNTV